MHESIEITEEERDGGFTLVELLIVIVILGILAAVTVFAVGGITDTARENTCALEQKTVATAAEGYRALPGNAGATPTLAALEAGNFLSDIPNSPNCSYDAYLAP